MVEATKLDIAMPPRPPEAVAEEIRQRVINVERKINILLREQIPIGTGLNAEVAVDGVEQFYGNRTFAQHGDDIVVLIIFGMIGINRPSYLDIGANDPIKNSNTWLFYMRGSRGINVEPNPRFVESFKIQRPEDINLSVGVAGQPGTLTYHVFGERSGLNTFDAERARRIEANGAFKVRRTLQIPVLTVNEIIDKYSPEKFPDYLSIDVEGLDYDILTTINYERSSPKVICVEGNSTQERQKMTAFLESRGYVLYFRIGANLIFLREQFVGKLRE